MPKFVRILITVCVLALLGAACEIDQVADPGVTPTLGPAPETGIERNVDPVEPTPTVTTAPTPTTPEPAPSTTAPPAPTTSVGPTPTTTAPPTTAPPTTAPPTTAPPTTAPNTTTPPTPIQGSPIYFNDFASVDASGRLDQFVAYRDPHLVAHTVGASDHASTGGVGCSAPETTRPQTRENPFGHVYLCHPGGDPAKGHQMAFAMDTAGYGFVGALPDQVFTGVREVRVDVNTTSAGSRNFVEIKVIPADATFVNAMPCGPELPCNAGSDYDDLGAVGAGTHSQKGTGLTIHTPASPDGISFSHESIELENGDAEHLPCPAAGNCFEVVTHQSNQDIRARYGHVLRDNGNGTLSFGVERADGRYAWITAPGSFPSGPVRVVIAFHNYTGTKSENGPGFCDPFGSNCPADANFSPSAGGFTWHWDNLAVFADSSTPSVDHFGGHSAERMVAPDGCISFAQGQRNNTHHRDVLPLFDCSDSPVSNIPISTTSEGTTAPLGTATSDALTTAAAWQAYLHEDHDAAFCSLSPEPVTGSA